MRFHTEVCYILCSESIVVDTQIGCSEPNESKLHIKPPIKIKLLGDLYLSVLVYLFLNNLYVECKHWMSFTLEAVKNNT